MQKCHLVMKRKARLSNLSIKTEQSPNYTHKLYSTGIKIIHSKWPGNDALFLRKNTMRQRLVAIEVDSERDFPNYLQQFLASQVASFLPYRRKLSYDVFVITYLKTMP